MSLMKRRKYNIKMDIKELGFNEILVEFLWYEVLWWAFGLSTRQSLNVYSKY
jgi:hypothetical protein